MNIAIASHGQAVGKCIPKRFVPNIEIEEIFDRYNTRTSKGERLTADWMQSHVGLELRHWAEQDEYASDLALIAAKRAFRRGQISPYETAVIRAGSSSPPCLYPGICCLVQNNLVKVGKPQLHLDAFDISAACTSGLHALNTVAETMICHPAYQYGLAIGAETMSKVIDPTDANFQVWGDGAAAIILEKTEEDRGIICSVAGSTPEAAGKTESIGLGAKYANQNIKANAWFMGSDVQKFVLATLIKLIPRTIQEANLVLASQGKSEISLADIKMFATHQANARIFELPAKRLKIPLDKFYVNFPEYANTSSASVLICLVEMIEKGLVQQGDLVMLVSFGGGLTWCSVLLRI